RRTIQIVKLGFARVEVKTAEAFLSMRDAAFASCVDLSIQSGFRSREEQAALYRAWRKGRGNRAARPGRSNHQSRRALDIQVSSPAPPPCPEATAPGLGFKRRGSGEPWHGEYVNAPTAHGQRPAGKTRRPARSGRLSSRARAHRHAGRGDS